MTKSTFLAVVLGLLLPVPLVFLTSTAYWELWSDEGAKKVKAVPTLALEETWKLQTYGQRCWRGEDCERPLGCLSLSALEREGICSDSWCMTDLQCTEGRTCQALPTLDDGPPVRACVDPGSRKEGEPCVLARKPLENTCASGLRCNEGWCGRPCQADEPTSCPQGFFCREGLNGPSCLPTCEATGCPGGQQCIAMGEGSSVCAVVRGENCQKVPCPAGGLCSVWPPRYKDSGLELRMACSHLPCGDAQPACPRGTSCVQGSCQRD